jgi:hypothetical protein
LMPVPSPQQIQYLNTFDGQELTIQKQPNTSLKDTNIRSPTWVVLYYNVCSVVHLLVLRKQKILIIFVKIVLTVNTVHSTVEETRQGAWSRNNIYRWALL